MSTSKAPETYERPTHGMGAEIKHGTNQITVTHPDGTRTTVPVDQVQKPKQPSK